MNQKVNIFFGYSWRDPNNKKNINSEGAWKKLMNSLLNDKRIGKSRVNIRRLRASAGGILLLDIHSMIEKADILIFDITYLKPNVLLELGIAYGLRLSTSDRTGIFIIKKSEEVNQIAPSDLHGLFVTTYSKKNGKIVFDDNNSLLQSIKSKVIAILNESLAKQVVVDELEETI